MSRPIEAAFTCDGERVVLTADWIGPALLVGDRALENHWRVDGADHFVTWEIQRGRRLALEYEISADRTTITRREYEVWRVTGHASAELPCESPAIAARAEPPR